MALFSFADVGEDSIGVGKLPSIKDFKIENSHVMYIIEIRVNEYSWTVDRRYSDFLDYDKNRFKHLKQSFLPGKKLLGNKDVDFLKKRFAELDTYLKTAFELDVLLQKKRGRPWLPRELMMFLDFDKYEIHGICEDLALDSSTNGENLLSSGLFCEWSPLNLHAINRRLNLPVPTCDENPRLDFGNLLDFCHRLQNLKIKGSMYPFGSSTIIPNRLCFGFRPFKSLTSLWVSDCDPLQVNDVQNCRKSVINLTIHNGLLALKDFFIDKDISIAENELDLESFSSQLWTNLKNVDLSFNSLIKIDKSVIFLRNIQTLNLSSNRLVDIDHLQHLPYLTDLDLSHNSVSDIQDWHNKLGNLKRLILTKNNLKSVEGFRRLYSLEYLDLRCNRLVQTSDIRPLGDLPCLIVVMLRGNPLDASVEYRSRVLEWFGSRADELRLDDEPTTRRELDAVGVRLAIRKAKEEREKRLKLCKERITKTLEGDLADVLDLGQN